MNHFKFSMSVFILDIETRPNQRLKEIYKQEIEPDARCKTDEAKAKSIEEKLSKSHKALSVSTDYSDIFCIGLKEVGKEARVLTFEQFVAWLHETDEGLGGGEETQNAKTQTFVTFNGKAFDLPVILKTAMKKGYGAKEFPYAKILSRIKKFEAFGHIDLLEVLPVYSKNKAERLETYLQIYLGKKKKPIDFETCTDDELRAHCLEDLGHTEELYLLLKDKLF